MGSKKKSKTSSTTHQESKPLDIVMPGYGQIASGVSNALNQVQGVNYNGDFVAQPGTHALAAPGMYADAANQALSLVPQAQSFVDQAGMGPQFGLGLPVLQQAMQGFGSTSPQGMQGAVDAAIQPYMRQLTEQVLPSLQSAGIESGAYGGTRSQQTLPGLAIRDAGRMAQEVAANLVYQDYNAAAQRQLEAYGLDTARGLGESQANTARLSITPELLNSVMRMSGGAADLMNQAGQLETANAQAGINNNLQRFNYDMTRPFMGYDTATDILSRLTAGFGTTDQQSKSKTTEKTGGLAPIIQGGLGLASGIASMAMGAPPIASAFGGGAGGGSLVSSLFGAGGNPFAQAIPQLQVPPLGGY